MDKILKELKINEKYSKPVKIKKEFSKVKDNIPLKADYNFMADLLELPETKKDLNTCWWWWIWRPMSLT